VSPTFNCVCGAEGVCDSALVFVAFDEFVTPALDASGQGWAAL
jgi:hypothetical protein